MSDFLSQYAFILIPIVKVVILVFLVLTVDAYLTLLERKVIAHIQARWGPYRVGPHGLLQPLADGVKFILKEDPLPQGVDKKAYFFAPFLTLMLSLTSLAVIPFGPDITIFGHKTYLGVADVNISLLVLFAITALSVYGVALAGWGSNNKYSLLGGLRSSAQMISYELAMTLSVVGVLLMAGTFSLKQIVEMQHTGNLGILGWNLFGFSRDGFGFTQIIGCVCFFIAAIAETNRIPFDLPEAESELVAGYHTEYASMKFAMFFIGEYTAMITVSCLSTILFFGGWLSPFPATWTFTHYLPSVLLIPIGLWVFFDGIRYETIFGRIILPAIGTALTVIGVVLARFPAINEPIQGPFWFLLKVFAVLFFYIWMRGTLPRFRYDQLMDFGWKFLLPLSIANVVITSAYLIWRMNG
ncbi:MAG TPA: NADH-quinone oxidoreductase subunit NuoH [Candidatus Eisenbacteria bacterium]|nr:NADH-quinone oxidoreductase subunit NuoH [Candidatus Eisenbacteria bacterium]